MYLCILFDTAKIKVGRSIDIEYVLLDIAKTWYLHTAEDL